MKLIISITDKEKYDHDDRSDLFFRNIVIEDENKRENNTFV